MKQDSLEVLFQRYPLGIQFCIAFGLSQVSTQVMLRQNRCSSESLERKMIISNFGCKLCYMQCSHISHQTGATSLTLSENTVVLTPVSIATRNIHIPKHTNSGIPRSSEQIHQRYEDENASQEVCNWYQRERRVHNLA